MMRRLEVKAASLGCLLLNFGPGGLFEQDDAENWQYATRTAAGHAPGWPDYPMGLGIRATRRGDTRKVGKLISETNARTFYSRWQQMLNATSWRELSVK